MNQSNTISNETLIINIERKKDSTARGIGKVFAFTFGGLGMFISCLLFLTIIGILPAIGLFFMSLGLIYVAQGKQQVKCPHCKKHQPILKTAENFTCPKCKKLTVINWN
ncbi:hypothetical protein J1P26_22105 [Neobacillus sp. MM2021_6]|uniref:hypothetical protein n=1 Tax=Bacillaceae TaxID=186817 RepID=UPI00140D7758|nr:MULTISPECIES: hypothetical protein [Bacillaceae]MBO0962399.1 hypothetical protein [Neobacillus sp. MM2021_6]NHC21032.1 hypothetical protein [Bacillus sp. MM2020_4]